MGRCTGLVLCCLLLSGCLASIPEARGPQDVSMPEAYAAKYRPPSGAEEQWWRGFDDPALEGLVEKALAQNLDITAARARLERARAFLRAERGDRFPSLDLAGSIELESSSDGDVTSASAGAFALFDPDLSGRLSAEIQAAAAAASAAEYLVADQRRIIAASVALQFIELRRTGERLALLEQSTQLQEQTLRVVTLRYEAGLSANLDVRRAAADLSQTRAQRGLLELERARAAHSLAVLAGETPGETPMAGDTAPGIPSYGEGPPIGVPADLLRRRPDLLVSEARLIEAAAQIGIERSDLMPSLTIPGEVIAGDGTVDGLFSEVLLTVGAALDLPLFDGGRRRAEVDAAEAEAEARFSDYRQSILEVLAEVENALAAIEAYSDRNEDLAQTIEESEAAFNQSNALYREGLATLFDVLDSQRQLIASRESLIDSQAALASSIVRLFSAVGDSPELPSEDELPLD